MPSFTQAELNTEVAATSSGDFSAADFLTIANRAVRRVLSDVDLRSSKRKVALSPGLMDDIFEYTCPSDLKGDKIIDIQPQINRNRLDRWYLTSNEEFDRYKEEYNIDSYGDPLKIYKYRSEYMGKNMVAISRDDMVNKLLLSRPVDDDSLTIDELDAVGTWEAFGDAENLAADSDNYVKGNASINWDIDDAGGTTAGIYNSSLDSFDISDYYTAGSAFVWVYLSSATNVTNFILRVGSSSSAYDSITVTTNNEGVAFYAGWNLLRFDFTDKSTTGSPTRTACDYVAIYMTKDAAKTSETDYRFDNLVLKVGEQYSVNYYSRYFWQSNTGTYLEDATATTDLINCETDEFDLIISKTSELMEKHLKNMAGAKDFQADYGQALSRYKRDNMSEALLMTQTYFDL